MTEIIKITPSNHIIMFNKTFKILSIHLDRAIKGPDYVDDEKYWKRRNLNELVGKYVIRSKIFTHKNGIEDNSYCDEIIKILNKNSDGSFNFIQHFHNGIEQIKKEWNDGNWVETPEDIYLGQIGYDPK